MIAKMLVVQGRPAGKSLIFSPGDYYLGRGGECQIRINSDWVSRQHCVLRVTETEVILRDLGSRNGTLVNGVLVTGERPLAQGDHIQIGPLVFQLQIEGGVGQTTPPNGHLARGR
jgi:pSer/pThr/pTyr-binding forkhead associated (FHA) protein